MARVRDVTAAAARLDAHCRERELQRGGARRHSDGVAIAGPLGELTLEALRLGAQQHDARLENAIDRGSVSITVNGRAPLQVDERYHGRAR
jgi:hypothetical protein